MIVCLVIHRDIDDTICDSYAPDYENIDDDGNHIRVTSISSPDTIPQHAMASNNTQAFRYNLRNLKRDNDAFDSFEQ